MLLSINTKQHVYHSERDQLKGLKRLHETALV